MPKVGLFNKEGKQVGDIELNEAVFGAEVNESAVHQVVVAQLANKRQGTQSAKTRAEVRGGGIKPWRQKGTGRARQGSTRAPQWYHGGIVFGPHPRTYKLKMNKKERALALKSVLSYKNKDNEIIVLDNFDVKTNKTKDMINILNTIKAEKNILIVVNELTDNLILGTRNLPKVDLLEASEINVLDILAADCLVITEDAVKAIEEVLK